MAKRAFAVLLLQNLPCAAAKPARSKGSRARLLLIRCRNSKPAPEQGKSGRSRPGMQTGAAPSAAAGNQAVQTFAQALGYVPRSTTRAMAAIELSVLGRDLPHRVGDRATLERHVHAWRQRRNAAAIRADWQFTTNDARIKLRKLYPTMEE
jgi:hypothetical protein